LEYQFRKRDGSVGVGEVTISLLQMKDGQPVGARGIVRDVTQRKRFAEELQKAKEAAEEASQAKSTFLTNVSHELRTPLTSVLGFAKMVQKRLVEQVIPHVDASDARTARAVRQVEENLRIVVDESLHLKELINGVLDLSTIESDRAEGKKQPVALAPVVERAVAEIRSAAEQKGLHLQAEVEADLPAVVGDEEHLVHAVRNLLSNAVKFSEHGTITCRVARARDEVIVRVTDPGIGIAAADHARVFERFLQIGDPLTGKPAGTGLGLPICKQIVERHWGRIWVESDVGKGATFSFALPVAARSAAERRDPI
jgi:signal transduction histidine kinase